MRAQSVVLVLLFAAIAAVSPTHDAWEIAMLTALGILQLLESQLAFAQTIPGKIVWILLKLALAYLLIGYTGGVESSYYLLLLFPIVSAATSLEALPTLLFSLLACASYLSFLLFIDWTQSEIPPDQIRILIIRLLFLAIVGNLVNALAQALRDQNARLKSLTEDLRRADRLAALGQLSAGLAHELRNPLGTIRASAEILARNVPAENALATEMAGFISSEVDRTNSLVTRFLDFARPLTLRKEPARMETVITRAIELVHREHPDADIQTQFSESAAFPMDAELMEHVFYNLILNAVQAGDIHSPIRVTTRNVSGSITICVIDRGSGIEPHMRESIFNPFVTTKPSGVGLGLPIVSKIVDEHGGTLTVDSTPGEGSTFRVTLPAQ